MDLCAAVPGWEIKLLSAAEAVAADRGQEYLAVLAAADTPWYASCSQRGFRPEEAPRTRAQPAGARQQWLVKRLGAGSS